MSVDINYFHRNSYATLAVWQIVVVCHVDYAVMILQMMIYTYIEFM